MANGHISDLFADKIAKAILTRDITQIPTSYFIGVTLELPSDANGTGLVVPTAPEYARVEVVAQNASWASLGVGSRGMQINVDVTFAVATVSWGELRGYTMYDQAGVFLAYGITQPYTILTGTQVVLPAGLIQVSLPF